MRSKPSALVANSASGLALGNLYVRQKRPAGCNIAILTECLLAAPCILGVVLTVLDFSSGADDEMGVQGGSASGFPWVSMVILSLFGGVLAVHVLLTIMFKKFYVFEHGVISTGVTGRVSLAARWENVQFELTLRHFYYNGHSRGTEAAYKIRVDGRTRLRFNVPELSPVDLLVRARSRPVR